MVSSIENFVDRYYLLFTRTNAQDLTNGRMDLWRLAFDKLNIFVIAFGHGIGSKDAYLSQVNAAATSFHSLWIDLFYEGGLLFVTLFLMLLYKFFIDIKRSKLKTNQKMLFYNFLIILILSGFGDAVALPFMLDTSVIVSTLMFISLPITFVNGNKIERIAYE